MIKGILFDYDGTLSNYTQSVYNKYRIVLHEFFPDLDVNDVEFETIVQQCMYWDENGIISKRHVFGNLNEKYGLDLDVVQTKYDWYMTFYQNQVLNEDCIEVLETLKKDYKLGIVTNGWSAAQHQKIDAVNIRSYFDTVVVSDDYGISKPDPRIYEIAAKQLGLEPSEIVFVGDSFMTDILGAYRAGMVPVWICSDPLKQTVIEDKVKRIYNLKGLVKLLNEHS